MKRRALAFGPAFLAMLVAASCGQELDPPAGLMLAITSDGPLPIDRLELRVSSKDRVLRSSSYRVPVEAALPTTLAIATNGNATAAVNITVVGWNDNVPLDRRDAIVTQVPTDRLALLPVVLSGRCSGKVTVRGGEAVSTCSEGSTCDPRTGDCTSAKVDGTSLDSYNEGDEAALGLGGSGDGNGNGGGPGLPLAGESSGGNGPTGGQPPTTPGGAGGADGTAGGASGAGGDSGTTLIPCTETCSSNHGEARCEAGKCEIDCKPGFADCNDDRKDGCEADLTRDALNCSKCNKACPVAAGGSAWCREGTCGETVCASADVGDCNGEPEDACEIDLTSAVKDCGTCGHECTVTGGQAACQAGACTVASCGGSLKDCKNGYDDGCETDTANDAENCGACGEACLTTPDAHVTSNLCVTSSCAPSCAVNYDSCDGNGANGCEQSLSNDAAHCGACNKACLKQNASATACSGGICTPTCSAGWGACINPEAGCTTPLGTTTDCGACGDACGGPKPFCSASGCADHLDIAVMPGGARTVAGWQGASSTDGRITLNHSLSNPRNSGRYNRMLLVGVAATKDFVPADLVLNYDATVMTRAVFTQDSGSNGYAAVYYLLDSQLPTLAGVKTVSAVFSPSGFKWGHAGVDIVELANVSQSAPLATGTSSGATCSGASRSVTVNLTQPGSLVYAVLSASGATSAPLVAATGLTETWNQHQQTPDHLVGAAAWIITGANRTVSWTLPTCYATAQVGVAIKRIGL